MRVVLALAAALLIAGCSSEEPSSPPPTSTSQSPRDVAKADYLKTLKDQAVRYRDEEAAFKIAKDTCANLKSAVGGNSQRLKEQWAQAQLVLGHDLSDRDATLVLTAVQNSKICNYS